MTEIIREYSDEHRNYNNDSDSRWRVVAHYKFTELISEKIRKKSEY